MNSLHGIAVSLYPEKNAQNAEDKNLFLDAEDSCYFEGRYQ